MQFTVNDETIEQVPDAAFVLQTIEQAAEDDELLFELDDNDTHFEIEGSRADGFVCFYDNDTTGEILQDAEDELDAARAAVLIELYAQGDPAWRTAIQWKAPPPPKPSLALESSDRLFKLIGWSLAIGLGSMFLRAAALVLEVVSQDLALIAAEVLTYGAMLALLIIYVLYLRLFVRDLRPQFTAMLKAQYAVTGPHTIIEMVVWLLGILAPLAAGGAFFFFVFQ